MFVYLSYLGGRSFYVVFGTLLPALLRARRPREHQKILKIHRFLRVESPLRLFRATPKTTKIQSTGVAKNVRKSMPKKEPTRAETSNKKTPFLTPKWLHFGAKNRQKIDLEAKSAQKPAPGPSKSPPERSWGASRPKKKTLVTSKSAQEEFWSDFTKKEAPAGVSDLGRHGDGKREQNTEEH